MAPAAHRPGRRFFLRSGTLCKRANHMVGSAVDAMSQVADHNSVWVRRLQGVQIDHDEFGMLGGIRLQLRGSKLLFACWQEQAGQARAAGSALAGGAEGALEADARQGDKQDKARKAPWKPMTLKPVQPRVRLLPGISASASSSAAISTTATTAPLLGRPRLQGRHRRSRHPKAAMAKTSRGGRQKTIHLADMIPRSGGSSL